MYDDVTTISATSACYDFARQTIRRLEYYGIEEV